MNLLFTARATLVALASFTLSCTDNGLTTADEGVIIPTSDSTVASINQRIQQDPNNPDLYNERALQLMQTGELETAFYDIRRAVSIDSTKARYFMTLGEIYFMQQEGSKSLQAFKQASKLEPDNEDALMKQAELYLYLSDPEEALIRVDQVLLKNKYNAKAYFMKGMAFKFLGDTLTALSSFQTAVEQDPEYFHAYMQLGDILATRRDPIAEQYYINAINVNPNRLEAHYNLGMLLQSQGRAEEALRSYQNLLSLDPNNRDGLYNYAFVNSEIAGDYKTATERYKTLLEKYPEDYEGWYMLGYTYERLGDKTGALGAYKKALVINPNYELALMGLQRLQ